jgi:outer membrane protein assembly factor BamE (lipoprotein component of BamABCDE complex)
MPSWRAVALWIALATLAGCASDSSESARGDVSNVNVGMTQGQVLSVMGQPQRRESYGPTEFLFYTSSYGVEVPIAIVDGKVTSIGRAAYDIVVRAKSQPDTTAAIPKKRPAP